MSGGRSRPAPTLRLELELAETVGSLVAGIDEAGRGALAGPVYAAAVILPLDNPLVSAELSGVTDSKLLTAGVREDLFPLICAAAISFGIGYATAQEIDRVGIIAATRQAMESALSQLSPAAQAALVDGTIRLTASGLPQRQVIRGDQLSLSIAAASILAKVSRDRHLRRLELIYPDYGFARHKGYGTAAHLNALRQHGPCAEHRHSFAPLREQGEAE